MPIMPGFLIGLVFIGVGIFILYTAFSKVWLFLSSPKRFIKDLTSTSIAQVSGQVYSSSPSKSPITQTSCALWECQVIEMVSTGKRQKRKTLYHQFSTQPIDLTDETGTLKIVPRKLSLHQKPHLMERQNFFSDFKNPGTLPQLERLGIKSKHLFNMKRNLIVTEKLVHQGQTVFVWGRIATGEEQQMLPRLLSDVPQSDYYLGIIGTILLGLVFSGVGFGLVVSFSQ